MHAINHPLQLKNSAKIYVDRPTVITVHNSIRTRNQFHNFSASESKATWLVLHFSRSSPKHLLSSITSTSLCYQPFYSGHNTHTRLTALFAGPPGWAGTRKVKLIWISLKQETVSGSGISWAICRSASRSRQITMPVPQHSSFFTGRNRRMPNQHRQSTEGKLY